MSQRTIILNTPTLDKRGGYRDAGERLVVGNVERDDVDIGADVAADLLASMRAMTPSDAMESAKLAAEQSGAPAPVHPLDHDEDGRPGGSKPKAG